MQPAPTACTSARFSLLLPYRRIRLLVSRSIRCASCTAGGSMLSSKKVKLYVLIADLVAARKE